MTALETPAAQETSERALRIAHGGVFLLLFALTPLLLPPLAWPLFWIVPLLAYGSTVIAIPALRRSFPGVPLGAGNLRQVLAMVALTLISCGVLAGYQWFARPELKSLAAGLPVQAFGSLWFAGVCFCLLNATLEEIVFRGILYDTLEARWSPLVAVFGTAALFGAGHWQGYPPGLLGVALASLYGAGLGLLRWRTRGLLLPICSHLCADATIFTILCTSGAFA